MTPLPQGIGANIWSFASDMFQLGGFGKFVALICGIILGLWVMEVSINWIIAALKRKTSMQIEDIDEAAAPAIAEHRRFEKVKKEKGVSTKTK